MLNYNLNLINSLLPYGTASRGSNYRPRFNWSFDERTIGIDAPNMDAIAHASFSINAIYSDVYGISNDSSGTFLGSEDTAVTASISGSGQWPVTGSTTMSLYIAAPGGTPENEPYYFSSSSVYLAGVSDGSVSGSIIAAEFTSSKNFIYYVEASIIHHKENEYNPLVKVLATGSNATYSGNSGSFTTLNIVKDQNVPVSMSIGYITGSQRTEFQYDYAFNITASLTGSANWPRSSSFILPTMSLSIPELSIDVVSYQTASILTASFAANTNSTYTITASIAPRYIPAFSASILVIGAGGGGAAGGGQGGTGLYRGGGGGAGGYQKVDTLIFPNVTYKVTGIGVGGAGGPATPGQADGSNGTTSSIEYPAGEWNNFVLTTLIASGGLGGLSDGTGGASGNGFAGGNDVNNGSGGGGGTYQTGSDGYAGLFTNATGGDGGEYLGGGGGGAINGGKGLGGGPIQITIPGTSIIYSVSGSGGDGGYFDGSQTVAPFDGIFGGGGGGGSYQLSTTRDGGDGGNGVVVIVYAGPPKINITNGYTNYIDGITAHYITGSGATFDYTYEPKLNPAVQA